MRQGFTVTLADPDTTLDVIADGRDVRAWEATQQESYYDVPMSVTKFTQMAWHAATRLGLFDGDWQEWSNRCTGAVPYKADPTVEPTDTPKAPTARSSASSPSSSAASPRRSKPKGTQ